MNPVCRTGQLVNGVSIDYSACMKMPKLTAVIEKEENWFVAHCPELGVTSQGRTIPEAEAMIQEAVDLFLESADEAEVRRRLELAA